MVVFKPAGGVAAAGTPNTHDLGASLNDLAAQHLAISNTHATGILEVTFSVDGSTYTSEFDVNPGDTVVFDRVNVAKVKVDANTNATTYTVAGWRD